MNNETVDEIRLGSGELYHMAFTGTIPTHADIEIATNRTGYIKSGATLEYKPELKEVFDDLRKVIKTFLVKEDVTFKSGLMTWDLQTLELLSASGTYVDDETTHKRTLTLGKAGAIELTQHLFRFVHTKTDGNKFRVTLVATAQNGFSLAFKPDDATVIDAELKAAAHDSDGTLVILEEEYGTAV
ncbi:MAG: hypothetical protein PHT58_07220 [Eubacteriales bacterium]|nr:hypothetical protein [Eubacteriales bacterium]